MTTFERKMQDPEFKKAYEQYLEWLKNQEHEDDIDYDSIREFYNNNL